MGTIGCSPIASTRSQPTPAARRKLFEFAKAMGVDTIVVPSQRARSPALDALADRVRHQRRGVCATRRQPARVVKALDGRSKRLGVGIDTGVWAAGRRGAARWARGRSKDRLRYVNLRDRAGSRRRSRNVLLGQGAGKLTRVLQRAEPPERPAAGDDARYDRSSSRRRRICSPRSTRSKTPCSRPTASTSPSSRRRGRSGGIS